MSKLVVALLFGGRSGEHEVSRKSAYAIAKALNASYHLFPIGISKDGEWYGPIALEEIKSFGPEKFADKKVTILPNPRSGGKIYSLPEMDVLAEAKVFFPVLHGTFGEDGTLQGLLEMAGIPYVGSGVLASAAGMDKVTMKRIFAQAGLPQVQFLSYLRSELENNPEKTAREIEEKLKFPCFVKPANMGSSVGISKATNQEELIQALKKAARYDQKIIVEAGVNARELEVAVLGNSDPQITIPGEIIPCNEFYDYKAKYIDDRSLTVIPADITEKQTELIREIASKAYLALGCSGLSRVDFFLTKDTNEVLINEINTMPGFTEISMYPKLWEHSRLGMNALVTRLVELAFERHNEITKNTFSYED